MGDTARCTSDVKNATNYLVTAITQTFVVHANENSNNRTNEHGNDPLE